MVEEWEDPNYRLNKMINPEWYINNFNKETNTFEPNDMLPFFVNNISFLN